MTTLVSESPILFLCVYDIIIKSYDIESSLSLRDSYSVPCQTAYDHIMSEISTVLV